MNLKKWSYSTQEYEDYSVPDNRNICLIVPIDKLNEICDCANCGKKVIIGDTYTSRTIHNKYGFGYCICEDCYSEEFKEEMKYNKNK